jgi:hypothetical protein
VDRTCPERDFNLGNIGQYGRCRFASRYCQNFEENRIEPLLANKTVTFSFGEDYDFLPSLLASVRSADREDTAKRRGDLPQNFQSSKWCPVVYHLRNHFSKKSS